LSLKGYLAEFFYPYPLAVLAYKVALSSISGHLKCLICSKNMNRNKRVNQDPDEKMSGYPDKLLGKDEFSEGCES